MAKTYRVKITKPTIELKQSLELSQSFSMQLYKKYYNRKYMED